jgi:hypothetical protein
VQRLCTYRCYNAFVLAGVTLWKNTASEHSLWCGMGLRSLLKKLQVYFVGNWQLCWFRGLDSRNRLARKTDL